MWLLSILSQHRCSDCSNSRLHVCKHWCRCEPVQCWHLHCMIFIPNLTILVLRLMCYWLCAASPDSMQPVQALLEVAAYPDQSISAISFNFWHRLMRHLTSGFSLSDDDQQHPQSEVKPMRCGMQKAVQSGSHPCQHRKHRSCNMLACTATQACKLQVRGRASSVIVS